MTDDVEPTLIVAGDTVRWSKFVVNFESPDWSLTYDMVSKGNLISIPTVADPPNHNVEVDADTSEGWEPGQYSWTAKARRGAEVFTVDKGVLEIVVNFSTQESGFDARSTAQIIVDNLTQAYVDLSSGKALVANYAIGDSTFTFRSADDVLPQLKFWEAKLAAEKAKQRIQRGETGRRQIKFYL